MIPILGSGKKIPTPVRKKDKAVDRLGEGLSIFGVSAPNDDQETTRVSRVAEKWVSPTARDSIFVISLGRSWTLPLWRQVFTAPKGRPLTNTFSVQQDPDLIKTESRKEQGPHGGRSPGPGPNCPMP
ncbi:hypothetical protein TNCV_816101 [Trichonephila clavipes]|nr:hypothetical protein TNCV_816101 [Trichonephila clavipes]